MYRRFEKPQFVDELIVVEELDYVKLTVVRDIDDGLVAIYDVDCGG